MRYAVVVFVPAVVVFVPKVLMHHTKWEGSVCGESRTHGLEGETVEGRPATATLP